MYEGQFPERVQLLRNMGFEWNRDNLPDEWDVIRTGRFLCFFIRFFFIFSCGFTAQASIEAEHVNSYLLFHFILLGASAG